MVEIRVRGGNRNSKLLELLGVVADDLLRGPSRDPLVVVLIRLEVTGVGDLAQVELLQKFAFLEVVFLGVEDLHDIERRPAAGRNQLREVRLWTAGDELDLAAHRFHLGDDLLLEVLLPRASPGRHPEGDAVELSGVGIWSDDARTQKQGGSKRSLVPARLKNRS